MKNHLLRACAVVGLAVLAVACTQPGGPPATTTTTTTLANQAPTAAIAPSSAPLEAPAMITFNGSGSTDTDGTVDSWDWTFGDSATGAGASVSHTYAVAGTYEVTLTVTDDDGATDVDSITFTIVDDPTGRYVAPTGVNAGGCGASAAPCLTIGYAVTQANTNDTVHVAAGNYPEIVTVNKSLEFEGANVGIAAGVDAGTRGAESVVKGFRNPGNPGSVQYSFSLDGFRIDPQGDAAMLAASAQPAIWIHGGPTLAIRNNVVSGGAFVPNCSFNCTTMADYAILVRSGNISIADNRIENYRRPLNIQQTTAATPILSASVTDNVFTGITSRAIALGQATGQTTMPGVTVSGNQIDAVGRTSPSSPAGITVINDSNVITGNTFTGVSTGVYLDLCKKWSQQNNQITANTFTGNSTGVLIVSDPDGGACVSGTSEGTAGWIVGGGRLDGLVITGNNFSGNTTAAIRHIPTWIVSSVQYVPVYSNGPIDASCNFYGNPTGPTNAGNPSGTGEAVVTNPAPDAQFTLSPWRTASAPGGACDGTP